MAELKPSFPKKLKGVIGSARARANELARARLIDSLTEGALTTNNFQIPPPPQRTFDLGSFTNVTSCIKL